MLGRSIRLFLIDGVPDGRWTCQLSNWTGKAYKIPRTLVKLSSDRPDLSGAGIYLLLGHNDENGAEQVYIGEAENVLDRLIQHLSSKDFWSECIVFVSKDDYLNKAHIKYLENRIYTIAKEANRYEVINSNTPTLSTLSEADRAEMEEFIINTKLLVSALGHKVLEPVISITTTVENAEYVYIKAARGADAKGKMVSDGFAVVKGSKIADSTVPSTAPSLVDMRNKLISSGTIDNNFVFIEDKVFSSPSSAAAVVMGRNANGLIEWKTEAGKTLKELEI